MRNIRIMNSNPIIITGLGIELTEALKKKVHDAFEKLFEHDTRIIRARVELEHEPHATSHSDEFVAKGHLEVKGAMFNVTHKGHDLYLAISELAKKLDRQIRKRHTRIESDRKRLHGIDLDATIPKTT